MSKVRMALQAAVFLLPASEVKNQLLRLLGHSVGPGVRVASTLVVGVRRFELAAGASINFGNVFRALELVSLGDNAVVGQWNWCTSQPSLATRQAAGATLRLDREAAIVARHYLDCTAGIHLEEFATLGGLRSTLLTHWLDYRSGRLATAPIHVGAYSLVNACNNIVAGANVPARSVTTMAATILPGLEEEGRLYGGVPAKPLRHIDGAMFTRPAGRVDD